MSSNIPSTQTIADRNISFFEAHLNKDVPSNLIAYNRVLSKLLAMNYTSLYKFASERILQNFAMTANEDTLEGYFGVMLALPRNQAVAAEFMVDLPATTGVEIPGGSGFIGDLNGERYTSSYAVVAAASVASVPLVADTPGSVGNLDVSDTLKLAYQIAEASSSATITSIETVGDDIEDIEDYRQRILFRMRAVFGGGNATDYKIWGEGVTGVQRVYPYAGTGVASPTPNPGDRIVYVEATEAIDADGIAPSGLLDDVRAAIGNDPVTLKSRPPLGITDETLTVQSIQRSTFDVTITGLDVPADSEVEAVAALSTFIGLYFRSVRPYVEAIDLVQDRNDVITKLTLSKIAQDVLSTYGGTATEATFRLTGGSDEDSYTLDADELAKLGAIDYA
jgi:uncharacterized phage protein gp47/JayE